MHLAKGETERAIGLLETPFAGSSAHGNGNLTATEHSADQNSASQFRKQGGGAGN